MNRKLSVVVWNRLNHSSIIGSLWIRAPQMAHKKSSKNSTVGYINEIIIFNRTLSQGEYQQVEGYLAWKWGLFSQLPSSHPFHSFQP